MKTGWLFLTKLAGIVAGVVGGLYLLAFVTIMVIFGLIPYLSSEPTWEHTVDVYVRNKRPRPLLVSFVLPQGGWDTILTRGADEKFGRGSFLAQSMVCEPQVPPRAKEIRAPYQPLFIQVPHDTIVIPGLPTLLWP